MRVTLLPGLPSLHSEKKKKKKKITILLYATFNQDHQIGIVFYIYECIRASNQTDNGFHRSME